MITKKVGYKRKQRVKDDVGRRTAQREMTPPCTRVRFRPPRMTHRMHQQRRPHSLRDITRACWLLQAHCAPPAPEQHAGRHRVVRRQGAGWQGRAPAGSRARDALLPAGRRRRMRNREDRRAAQHRR